jgi:hypothetical protein
MRGHPERLAWTVLSLAFATFCLLSVGIPLGVRAFLLNSRVNEDTVLQVIQGITLVQRANGGEPSGVTEAQSTLLSPQDEVITDASSWATLDLFDRSHVIVYSNSRLRLDQVDSPRYGVSKRPNSVALALTGGLMRVGVALPDARSTDFRVQTPHTTLTLDEGSYRIEVTNEGTRVTVTRGEATLTQANSLLRLPQGMRTFVDFAGKAAPVQTAARNLIENGSFLAPLHTAWVTNTVIYPTTLAPPVVEVVEEDGRQAVRLVRLGPEDGIHSEIAIQQKLDQDARDFARLAISLDVSLEFQSLSGGGLLSSEFPIIVRLDFKDRWGNNQFWTHGFYYHNRDGYPIFPNAWGQPSGEQIPRGVWFPYESGNLMELLGETRPAHITGLTVYASGWNYEGLVTEIQLIVE